VHQHGLIIYQRGTTNDLTYTKANATKAFTDAFLFHLSERSKTPDIAELKISFHFDKE